MLKDVKLLLALSAYSIDNTALRGTVLSSSISVSAEVLERWRLAVNASTRLSAVTSSFLAFFVCSFQRHLCPLADSSMVEVFKILAADWRQSLAASPLSKKCENFPGFLAGAGADSLFFSGEALLRQI